MKYLENKIDEINNDNKQAYDLLLVKYREALDINLHFIFEIKDIKNIFKSYEKKNI